MFDTFCRLRYSGHSWQIPVTDIRSFNVEVQNHLLMGSREGSPQSAVESDKRESDSGII